MNKLLKGGFFLPVMVVVLFCGATTLSLAARPLAHAYAATINPSLGTAENFAVLGNNTVTNTGPTTIIGNLGVSSGKTITGFPPGFVSGITHNGDSIAKKAQQDASTAYTKTAGKPCGFNLTGQDLASKILTPGTYCFTASAFLSGSLILDGQGKSDSVFIFQVGSDLLTTNNASVLPIHGAQPCHIFWQVSNAATLGTGTNFAGNILAQGSIRAMSGSKSNGGLYALNGTVTLDTNRIQTSDTITLPIVTYPVSSSSTISKPIRHS